MPKFQFALINSRYADLSILNVITLQLDESIIASGAECAAQTRGLPASPSEILHSC